MSICVLVADDDRRVVDAIQLRLQHEGFTVYAATGGREAIEAYEAFRPDVALLDGAMPDLSGFEVCHHIRSVDSDKRTRVYIVSGASAPSEEYIGRCVEACDVDGYVRKPFAFEILRRLLEGDVTRESLVEAVA